MDERIINNIKTLAIETISNAKSGHSGIALSSAPILYTLYAKHINVDVKNPLWINRDRFVMSAGHGSALLYSVLHFAGFDIKISDLKKFRQIDSITPGHPEFGVTPGVDMTTGPLGEGIASAVGMAIIGKYLQEKFVLPKMGSKEKGTPIFDYKVYVLCSDGDLMEGISYEAASLAGNLNLDNLVILYDSNNVSLDGDTTNTFTEDVLDRFKSFGWYTDLVRNGNDALEIDKAITKAKASSRPSIIEIKTILGKDTTYEGTNVIHGKPLTSDEVKNLKHKLGVNELEFFVDDTLVQLFRKNMLERNKKVQNIWNDNYSKYVNLYLNGDDSKLKYLFNNKVNVDLLNFSFNNLEKKSTRDLNNIIMQVIAELVPNFIGGSADLSTSTKTYLNNGGDMKDSHYDGRNIWFGVREHAMGAIANGMALSNFRPFCSTFLAFSDYLKPAIRMSCLMNLPVTYIFTHDSISIGEDGPTHEPVEQLASLRAIPNLNVFRPADMNELIGSWDFIINGCEPNALILSKQEFMPIATTDKNKVSKGAYIVRKETSRLNGIIIATGSEVHKALEIADSLYNEKRLDIRVISMPSVELFLKQDKSYYQELLPLGYKVIVIEAATSFGWHRFVYNSSYLITIDSFGFSGKSEDVLKKMHFDNETIKNKIERLLK